MVTEGKEVHMEEVLSHVGQNGREDDRDKKEDERLWSSRSRRPSVLDAKTRSPEMITSAHHQQDST